MFREPETWVAIAFVLFVGVGLYLKVPAMLAKMLDERADKISKELAEARKLREEAQALLAEYQKKRAEAEKDAANIVAQAKVEAESYGVETRKKLAETIERRKLPLPPPPNWLAKRFRALRAASSLTSQSPR